MYILKLFSLIQSKKQYNYLNIVFTINDHDMCSVYSSMDTVGILSVTVNNCAVGNGDVTVKKSKPHLFILLLKINVSLRLNCNHRYVQLH